MRVCFLGGYDASYPRNAILRKGLAANGIAVLECQVSPSFKFWLRYPLLFLRYLQHFGKHDVFVVPEFCQKDVPLARFLSILTRKKVVFDPLAPRYETKILDRERGSPGSLMAWWNHVLDSWSFRLSDLILADTQAHKDYYSGEYGLPSAKIAVLPVGFDDDVFKPVKSPKPEGHAQPPPRFSVLFFGSFLPLHGIDSIVQAAAVLSDRDSSIRFKIVGSGQTLLEAQALASKSDLKNIHFEGWVALREIPPRVAGADICLGIFGRTEKAGRVVPHKIFQAMAMRKPVITASTPAVREFFTHRENIYLCPEPYPETLAEAILEIERNPELRGRIAEAGFSLVRERYTPQALGKRLLHILDDHFFLISPYRGRVHPDFDHPEILQALKHCHDLLRDPSTRILLDSRNRVGVVSLPLPDGNYVDAVIKEFRVRGVDWLKGLVLPTKAFKAWRGATALVEREIGTPLPIAFLEPEGRPRRLSYFLSCEEKNVEEIRDALRRYEPEKLKALLAEAARHLAICHKRGILHRDLSDGNILVRESGSGSFRFFLIDTNRIRVKKSIGRFRGIKNLIRLGVPSELQRSFLKAYLSQSGLNQPFWLWYKWNKTLYTGTIRLKKALRLRKLARTLKIQ